MPKNTLAYNKKVLLVEQSQNSCRDKRSSVQLKSLSRLSLRGNQRIFPYEKHSSLPQKSFTCRTGTKFLPVTNALAYYKKRLTRLILFLVEQKLFKVMKSWTLKGGFGAASFGRKAFGRKCHLIDLSTKCPVDFQPNDRIING
jgi:hypothetical protein